jgi:peroxiredoxin
MRFCRRCETPGAGRRPLGVPAFVALALLIVVGAARGGDNAVVPPPGAEGSGAYRLLEPGAAAPDFALKDMAGEDFHFAVENATHAYVLVFWSVFCEPCRFQMAVVQHLYAKYLNAGLRVAAVALDGAAMRPVVARYVRQEGYAFPVLVDEPDVQGAFPAGDPYGVAGLPSTFIVSRGGRIAFSRAGPVKYDELEKAVQAALKP